MELLRRSVYGYTYVVKCIQQYDSKAKVRLSCNVKTAPNETVSSDEDKTNLGIDLMSVHIGRIHHHCRSRILKHHITTSGIISGSLTHGTSEF